MYSFREFETGDAESILGWIKDEHSFRQWSADTYKTYPAKSEDICARYSEIKTNHQGLVYPLMFVDDNKTVGHLIIRVLDKEQGLVRFGYVIVDSDKRGQGIGSKMLREALRFADEKLNAKRVTLGVFENNQGAFNCYTAVGFKKYGMDEYNICGDIWKCPQMEYIFN